MKKLTIEIKKFIKKLKYIDFIILGFSLLFILIFAFLFFRKSSNITVTVKVGDEDFYSPYNPKWYTPSTTKTWLADLFYEGQKEKDGLGKIKAEVLDVFSYYKTQNEKNVLLKIRLNTVYEKASNTHNYKGVSILIGSKIKLNLDQIYVNGTIVEVENFPLKWKKQKIIVETQIIDNNPVYLGTSGTDIYLANAININQEVKDNKGNTIIKIVDKKVKPAQKIVTNANGQVLLKFDPVKKDVFLILEINALVINNQYFLFEDVPIKIGYEIPINLPEISVFPIVTKFVSE